MHNFFVILVSVILNAVAQLFLKQGAQVLNQPNIFENILSKILLNPYIISGLSCYAVSILLWIYALSKVDVSVAYPMISIGFIINVIAAWYLFNEPINSIKIAGIFFIILGVFLIGRNL